MAKKENKMMRRRLANAWLSTVISISLVLLLVGVSCLLLLNARSVSDYFKESMQVSVLMKQEVSETEALAFQKELEAMPFVHSARYVSREQGIRELASMLGDDFLGVFETTPVPISFEMTLGARYVSPDSLDMVRSRLSAFREVDEVSYQQSLVDTLNKNLSRIALWFGVLILLLLFISFVLINNTVRLNVFARRFTVHTMKLVGATRAFIRSPFMGQALVQGLVSSLVAVAILTGALFLIKSRFSQLFEVFQLKVILIAMGVVLAAGVTICVVSTYFVVNKLVSLDKDELYS